MGIVASCMWKLVELQNDLLSERRRLCFKLHLLSVPSKVNTIPTFDPVVKL